MIEFLNNTDGQDGLTMMLALLLACAVLYGAVLATFVCGIRTGNFTPP
jgi:hypothetical protein